jgi:hypothetical protein
MSPEPDRTILKATGIAVGAVFLCSALAVATWRLSLVATLLLGGVFLLWTAITSTRTLRRRALLVCAVGVLLAGIPVDMSLRRTGQLGIRVVPLVWGLPTPETLARARAGELELAGCMRPLIPASYVLILSW